MSKILSSVAKSLRGEAFTIDDRVPAGYVLGFSWRMACDYLRGTIKFRSIRPLAFVGKDARILCASKITRKGMTKFAQNVYVDALSVHGIVLGRNFSLGRSASIECTGSLKTLGVGFTAGDNVGIGSFSFFGCAGGICIGSDTIIGNFVSMHSENHNYDDVGVPIRMQGVNHQGITVGENCWIGAKVTLLDGANVGSHSIIAAGAVVKAGKYPEHAILAGIPAKVVKLLA